MAISAQLDSDKTPDAAPSVNGLLDLVKDDLEKVNELIIKRMDSHVELIPTLASHIIAAGGKRLRPLLTLGAAKLCGYEGKRHTSLAACVEFIHTATLLHDDVVDESDLRRGNASANALWGNQASVLVGDFLFSRAFQLMVADGSLDVLAVLANASAVIAEGEVLQLMTTGDTTTTEEAYLEVISSKTAALFSAATRVGALVAGRPAAEADALDDYGRHLGVAFQLVDDALDYSAQQQTLGKTVGDDFREGKITLPVMLAFQRGDEEECAFWRRTLEDGDQEEGDLARALALIMKHGALDETMKRARDYGEKAKDALDIFPESAARQALADVVDFAVQRAY